jgi:SAM-dependent methyltransferase
MGEFKPASWYDDVYSREPNLTEEPEVSTFGPLWLDMAARVPTGARVLEIGCGAGQVAALIMHKIEAYVGFDFSQVAIEHACRRNDRQPPPPGSCVFVVHEVDDGYVSPMLDPDVLLACESFEHFDADHDLRVLSQHSGVHLIASLPMGNSASHVRHFPGSEDVRERYGDLIHEPVITPFGQWYILEGKIK